MDRIWLDVPFEQKDDAKAAGARWDPGAKRWYAPRAGMTTLEPWTALPPVPDLLPGGDRDFGSGLFVDLVPSSCWFTNVRSCVDKRDWDRLRRMVYGRAGNRCEACQQPPEKESRIWMEAHERWQYDHQSRVQTLRRLVCLCTRCHEATHFGLAQVRGNADSARCHLMSVNGWTQSVAARHIDEAFGAWRTRSRLNWTLDLTMLTDAGIRLAPPPDADERPTTAGSELTRRRSAGR